MIEAMLVGGAAATHLSAPVIRHHTSANAVALPVRAMLYKNGSETAVGAASLEITAATLRSIRLRVNKSGSHDAV